MVKKDKEEVPAIVIDTREQNPYEFPHAVRGTLKAGDYSLVGCEARVAIERKSLNDAYGSIGGARERFEREWQALSRLEYSAVVIESTLAGFLEPPTHSSMNPRSALLSYLAWHVKYGVPVFFAGDRRHAAALVQRLLGYWWKYQGCVGREEPNGIAGVGEDTRPAARRPAGGSKQMDCEVSGT